MTERLQLYDFQRVGVEHIERAFAAGHKGFLLYDDMGLGKTVQSLAFVSQMKLRGPVLVVGPKSCLHVWGGYQDRFAYRLRHLDSPQPFKNHDVVVVSYPALVASYKAYLSDLIRRQEVNMPQYNRLVQLYGPQVLPPLTPAVNTIRMHEALGMLRLQGARKPTPSDVSLFTTYFGLVILDEAHLLKNGDSKTSKAVGFVSRAHSLALTGTPIMNHQEELVSILKYGLCMFECDLDRLSEFSLGRRKGDIPELLAQQQHSQEQLVRLSWGDDLDAKRCYMQLTDTRYLSRVQAQRQLCLEPASSSNSSGLIWTPVSHSLFPRWTRDDIKTALCVLRRVAEPLYNCDAIRLAIASAVAHAPIAGPQPSIKMYWVDCFLRQPELHDKKVVCVSSYRTFFETYMAPYLTRRGFKNLLFSGDTAQKQKRVLDRFAADPSVRVLLLVKSAGALGLNLHTAASVCIIMDPHFNGAQDDQAAHRVDRIGQTQDVIIRRLVIEDSVDVAMLTLQDTKTLRIASALY